MQDVYELTVTTVAYAYVQQLHLYAVQPEVAVYAWPIVLDVYALTTHR